MAILSDAPKGAAVFDIDAARVARAEARAKDGIGAPFVKIAAGYVEVFPETSLEAAEAFGANNIRRGLELTVKDPADVDTLVASGLTAQDIDAILTFAAGKSLGESQA